MPRVRSPERDKAKEIYIEHKGNITNKKISQMLNEDERKIAVWKQRDRWEISAEKSAKEEKHVISNCIYKFINKNKEIIYIGKATNLTNRVKNHNHLPKECYMEIERIEYTSFNTGYDLDLAERYYIPKIKPKYNGMLKFGELTFKIEELDNKKWFEIDKNILIK